MQDQEVGRWTCSQCARGIVAASRSDLSPDGFGTVLGACPWGCGAWINPGLREVRPGPVRLYRASEWDARAEGALVP